MQLQRRFEALTDPELLSRKKQELRGMEAERKEKKNAIKKLETEQKLLDKDIVKNSSNYENLL